MADTKPLVMLNVVALTPALLQYAPNIKALSNSGQSAPLKGVLPALTMPAQASMVTGELPDKHGVVANGWYWRELGEVKNWVQSNDLLCAKPLYEIARECASKKGQSFTCAKMFWWFNQGARVEWSVTPKPHYGADGSKAFDILSAPESLAGELQSRHGRFPFFNFWGPKAGLPASQWIAAASADVIRGKQPTLTLVYLPHLDYDLQRKGPSGCDLPRLVGEVDACAKVAIDAAHDIGANVLVVSEYGIGDVSRPVYLNRILREAGLLSVRRGPFGEMLDTHGSRAFAVCDHQVAHVYVREKIDRSVVRELLDRTPGVGEVVGGLDHPRSGEFVAIAESNAWFAYPYWLDDAFAPDFARTGDIHRKPGYDPCELFIDPKQSCVPLRVALKLLRKKLGFRTLMDVIPLDASLVKGSHGAKPASPEHGPLIVSSVKDSFADSPRMTDVRDIALRMMGLVAFATFILGLEVSLHHFALPMVASTPTQKVSCHRALD